MAVSFLTDGAKVDGFGTAIDPSTSEVRLTFSQGSETIHVILDQDQLQAVAASLLGKSDGSRLTPISAGQMRPGAMTQVVGHSVSPRPDNQAQIDFLAIVDGRRVSIPLVLSRDGVADLIGDLVQTLK